MSLDLTKVTTIKKNPQKYSKQNSNLKSQRLIKITRVAKVTKGGKRISVRIVLAIGDENGNVAIGVAKADNTSTAINKAKANAEKNKISLPITKSLSITHTVYGSFGASKVIMKPAIEGSGVIAGGAVRIILETAGIKNIIAKQLGSKNLFNNAQAAINALKQLTTRSVVSKKRGVPLENLI